ncbi:MAG: MmgE/PrpD family protein [Pseudomonadota bacterium]
MTLSQAAILPADQTVTQRLVPILQRPISDADRQRAAWHLVDWLACTAIGATTESGALLLAEVTDRFGRDGLLPFAAAGPAMTAFGLGGLGAVLEMDDVHRTALLHPGPVIVPSALATAREVEASGTGLLEAIIRGYEAMIRLGRAVGPGHYAMFHNTGSCGAFGSAAAAGSVLGLDDGQMVSALGNAGTQSAGFWQCRHEPVMTKPMHNAHAAWSGVTAASLAARGFTGPASILEGPQGFFAATCPDGDPSDVVAEPNEQWQIWDTSFKPWPACRHAHPAIDAALALGEIDPETIASITVETYGDAARFCDRPHPTTAVEAKFSLQHAIAVVLVEGRPSLGDFEPAACQRSDLTVMRAKTSITVDAALDRTYPAHFGSAVEIIDESGRRHRASVADALGDPENPMDDEGRLTKARELLAAAGWSSERSERAIAAALNIADGGSLGDLLAALGDRLPASEP